jgi:7-carboxy-7-deazaguanine synthase
MKIAEIFYSLQGEIDVGRPSIFIRFSGCSLIRNRIGCTWCDTKYAEEGKEMQVVDIVSEIMRFPAACLNVVITGGESMDQKEGVFALITALDSCDYTNRSYFFDLETNGLVYDSRMGLFSRISCSPKYQSIDMDVLKKISRLRNARFKFVYERSENKWWEAIISDLLIARARVWIMKQGSSREEQLDCQEVVEYCKSKGYNYTPRLQVLLWGNKRSV